MSKKYNYDEVKLVKSKTKRSFKGLITFCICIFSIAFVVLLSSIFSGALTVGNFSNLFSKNKDIKVNAHSYYMVTMGKFDNISKAQDVASGTIVLGAGSFVFELNKSYYVVGSVYKTKEEATSVKNNIKDTNYTIDVVEVPFNKIEIIEKSYTAEQKKAVLDSILFFNSIYSKCYDFSIKLDKKEINTAYLSNELNSLKSDAKIWASKLDAINSVCVNEKTIYVKNAYINLIDALDTSVLKIINGMSPNRDIKYLTTSVVSIKYNLYANIC